MREHFRLAIDARMLHSSGIGTYLQNLLPRVLSDPALHPALLVGSDGASGYDVPVLKFEAAAHSLAAQLRYPRLHTDLLWFPNYNVPLRYRGRLVATVHDIYHLLAYSRWRDPRKALYARALFQNLRRRASAILCVSQFTADELMRHTGDAASRLYVTPLGVDPFWAQAPLERVPVWPRPFYLAVGNLKPHKNFARLIEAFQSVSDSVNEDLVIVGQMEGFIDSAQHLSTSNRNPRIHFLGRVDDPTLRLLYRGATALVFPSLYEGFGLPPLEAMAAGCPVLCSEVASLPEVCKDAAMYFDPLSVPDIAASMKKIAGDPPRAHELRARGRERAKNFSWNRTAALTVDVLKEQLAR